MVRLMQYYNDMKSKHSEAFYLFALPSICVALNDDAKVLTTLFKCDMLSLSVNGCPVKAAQFDREQLDEYMPVLTQLGYKVALCEPINKEIN